MILVFSERENFMSLKVLGISAGPRLKGNSDLLLREALTGAESAGAAVEHIRLCDLNIAPCIECNACYKTGECNIEDDYQMLSAKMLDVDRLIFATPIFFMTVCAQAKSLIDRCQCLWARKYIQNLPVPAPQGGGVRRGHLISTGGSGGETLFQCVEKTFKYFLDTLDAEMGSALLYREVDERGEIAEHDTAWDDAFRLGERLVSPSS